MRREPRRDRDGTLRIYVSFGTVVWRYWAEEALAALACISDVVGRHGERARPDQPRRRGGRRPLARSAQRLGRGSCRPVGGASRRRRLRHPPGNELDARGDLQPRPDDLVPLLRGPAGAGGEVPRVRNLDTARRLPRARLRPEDVLRALDEVTANRETMLASLEQAREWELEVMADRDAVVRKMLSLI